MKVVEGHCLAGQLQILLYFTPSLFPAVYVYVRCRVVVAVEH